MHDIADLEGRGLVGVFLASAEFKQAAAAQSKALGFPAAHVLVAHPIQDRTDPELQVLAEGAYSAVLRALTTGTGSPNSS